MNFEMNDVKSGDETEESSMENIVYSMEALPLTLKVEELMPVLGIGRNTAYELVRSGKIRSIRIGRKIRVPRDAVAEFLHN